MQDVLDHVRLDRVSPSHAVARAASRRPPLDLDRPLAAVLVVLVAHGDLRLAVGPQLRQLAGLAHLREPLADLVREHDRQRHQLRRLVGRVAEHHPLVAGADRSSGSSSSGSCCSLVRRVDALRDVGRLLVDRDHHAARLRVEAQLRACSRSRDRLAHDLADVDVRLGRDLAGDDDEARRDQRLAGDAAARGPRASTASSTASEIWSATLSGCPSVTDSEVKRNSRTAMPADSRRLDLEEPAEVRDVALVVDYAMKLSTAFRFAGTSGGQLSPAARASPSIAGTLSRVRVDERGLFVGSPTASAASEKPRCRERRAARAAERRR